VFNSAAVVRREEKLLVVCPDRRSREHDTPRCTPRLSSDLSRLCLEGQWPMEGDLAVAMRDGTLRLSPRKYQKFERQTRRWNT